MKFAVSKVSEKRFPFGIIMTLLLKSNIFKLNELTLRTLRLAKSFRITEMEFAWRGILRLSSGMLQMICREFNSVQSKFMLADIRNEIK